MAILTQNELDERLAEIHSQLERLSRMHARGMITEEETVEKLHGIYDRQLLKLLHQNRYRIDRSKDPWLRSPEGPASQDDHAIIQQLINALHIPEAWFEPIPKNLPYPSKLIAHRYYNSATVKVFFSCVDNNGLDKGDPDGKTFVLKDDKGLAAHIRVLSHDASRYFVNGTLEGYTDLSAPKDMTLYISRHFPYVFDYMEEEKDLTAYNHFPLWQEYFQYIARKEEKIYKEMLAVVSTKQ